MHYIIRATNANDTERIKMAIRSLRALYGKEDESANNSLIGLLCTVTITVCDAQYGTAACLTAKSLDHLLYTHLSSLLSLALIATPVSVVRLFDFSRHSFVPFAFLVARESASNFAASMHILFVLPKVNNSSSIRRSYVHAPPAVARARGAAFKYN